jgi:large subunit ribosomal protein L9
MKVILNDHVEHLGERGDAVTVKPGYARNYLFPQGLAYPDTPGNRRRFEEEQAKWEEMDLQRRSAADKLAADLEGLELTFDRRAGENDVLFGSVNLTDIGRALADKGFDLDRRRIQLHEPIKEIGTQQVEVRVYMDTTVTITVHVVRPGQEVGVPAGEEVAVDLAPAVEAPEATPLELAEPAEGPESPA